jgi:hypothetical protein
MGLAVGHANQHETPAADISCRWVHDREGKSRGYGSIDRIPSRLKNLSSNLRGKFVHAHHHPVLRVHGAGGSCGGRDQT